MGIDVLDQIETGVVFKGINIRSFYDTNLSNIYFDLGILYARWEDIIQSLYTYCVEELEKEVIPTDFDNYRVFDGEDFTKVELSEEKKLELKTREENYHKIHKECCKRFIEAYKSGKVKCNDIFYFNEHYRSFNIHFYEMNNDEVVKNFMISGGLMITGRDHTVTITQPSIYSMDPDEEIACEFDI